MTHPRAPGSLRPLALGLTLTLTLVAGAMLLSAVTRPTLAAAAGLSAVERLVAEDEIRQQIARYGLLADGDGMQKKDLRTLADTILAPGVISDVVLATGTTSMHMTGRDEVVNSSPPAAANAPTAGRHYLIATAFDELTATSAKTRTTSLYLNVTKNMVGADCEKAGVDACGGRVVRAVLFVYHDTWTRTAQGWQKTRSVLRRDT